MKPEYKLVAKNKYIALAAALADEIWREAYARRFTPKQLTAILTAQQSAEAIEAEMDAGSNYFIVLLAEKPVGYYAWVMRGGTLVLTQLYLKAEVRRRGIGRDIVQSCERLARADGKGGVEAVVGQKCLDTQAFFKALGYRQTAAAPAVLAEGISWDTVTLTHRL